MSTEDDPRDEAIDRAVGALLAMIPELEAIAKDLLEGGDIEFSQGILGLASAMEVKLSKRYPDIVALWQGDLRE